MSFTAGLGPAAESEPVAEEQVFETGGSAMIREERNPWAPIYFGMPAVVAMVSALAGGVPALTDLAFVMLTVLCAAYLISEFRAFSFRWGIGGMMVFGGVLIFFCYDYLLTWMGQGIFLNDAASGSYSPAIVATAAAHHMIFVVCMLVGLRLRFGGRFERFLAKFPEPGSPQVYLILVWVTTVIGLIPYAFFTQEGLVQAVINGFWGGRASGTLWTIGRTGNLNFAYGAYLAQLVQIGTAGAILGAFYAVCITRSWWGRIGCMLPWLLQVALAFGTGTRGAVLFVALPVVGFLFIRYQAQAAAMMRRVSLRGYLYLTAALLAMLLVVQVQITFRGVGFRDADVNQVWGKRIEGNHMFTESLRGFYLIPEYLQPFYDRVPGQAIVMPVVDTVFWFVVSPIPRAVWTTKPVDPVWQWYNNVVTGGEGTEGTTVSHGAVGHWYFRFGLMGTIQGGLIIGFMMGFVERLLREYAPYKPILIVVALGCATFLFRCYRGLQWVEFHATLVGLVALAGLVIIVRGLFGGTRYHDQLR
jgi:hypothetical protein